MGYILGTNLQAFGFVMWHPAAPWIKLSPESIVYFDTKARLLEQWNKKLETEEYVLELTPESQNNVFEALLKWKV